MTYGQTTGEQTAIKFRVNGCEFRISSADAREYEYQNGPKRVTVKQMGHRWGFRSFHRGNRVFGHHRYFASPQQAASAAVTSQ